MRMSLLSILGYCLSGIWTAWGGRKRIEKKQLKNLRKLVAKARKDSPYFQRLYKGLPDTEKINLCDLPITSLREHMSDIKNLGVPYGNIAVFRTSGTSGEPAVIIMSASDLEFIFGISLARLDRKQMSLIRKLKKSGSNITITGGKGHFVGAGINKLMHYVAPRFSKDLIFVSAELPIHQIVQELNQIPNVASINTYPSTLAILVREKEAGRLKINPLFIKVGGETLTQELRNKVKHVFPSVKPEIMDAYGCTECLLLSFECHLGRKHVPEDWIILEALDAHMQPAPDGELGQSSLLTVLTNKVQPFIRYELGDQIRFYAEPCPCGSAFRSFEVVGRQATLLHIGDVVLSPLIFDLEQENAQRVQLVQIDEREFDLRIELLQGASRDLVFNQVISSIETTFRENGISEFKINRSQKPPLLAASGKFHEIIPLKKNDIPF
jgi:phenylacetate-coenzyme A ligase PaaK-like adenylate-forming protein